MTTKLVLLFMHAGFMPAELDVRSSGLVEPLGGILSQLIGGGGAAKVNIDKVQCACIHAFAVVS